MMLRTYITQQHQKKQKQPTNFYTSSGLHIFFQQPLLNKEIDVESVVNRLESMIPSHLLQEIEMIIFGTFEEFKDRSINAMYKDGALYVSNAQDSFNDLLDDLVHESAHSLESKFGLIIYGDSEIEKEFLRKREHLHDLLWSMGYKAPKSFFTNLEYDKEFDMFLYETVGYEKLAPLMSGLFLNPYAATSINEYFATGYTDYYMDPSHGYLKKVSPALYKKIFLLQDEKNLDTY